MRDAVRAKATYTLTTKEIESHTIRESPEPNPPPAPSSDEGAPLINPPSHATATENGVTSTDVEVKETTEAGESQRSEVVANGDAAQNTPDESSEVIANGDATQNTLDESSDVVANGGDEEKAAAVVSNGHCAAAVASEVAETSGGEKLEEGEADSSSDAAVANGVVTPSIS